MPWDATKPAGTDAANTLDNTIQPNFSALDTWASAITDGVTAGAAAILRAYRAANATFFRVRSDAADTVDRFNLDLNGAMQWGPGNAAVEVTLQRASTRLLTLGTNQALAQAFNRVTATVDVVNTVAATVVYTFSVPGGTLGTDRGLRLCIIGDYLNNSGAAADFALSSSYGGTTLFTRTELLVPAFADRRALWVTVELHAKAATNAQVSYTCFELGSANSATNTGQVIDRRPMAVQNSIGVDSTAAQTFSVTVQHGTAHANISARLLTARLEVV